MSGDERIAAERKRQIEVEDWTAKHAANHVRPEALALAAACYAMPEEVRDHRADREALLSRWEGLWPWAVSWWKPGPTRIRDLEKAGALIAAEIDRLEALP